MVEEGAATATGQRPTAGTLVIPSDAACVSIHPSEALGKARGLNTRSWQSALRLAVW